MKKNAIFSGFGFASASLLCAAVCLALAGTAAAQTALTQYCQVELLGCPNEYHGKNLVVPLDVIAISAEVQACSITEEAGSGVDASGTPAVMFIIDHSLSMRTNSTSGNDPQGNRFRVTNALIDSIYKVYPNAEVGIAVFAEGLIFDSNRDSNLVRFDGVIDVNTSPERRQSYMPLRVLDGPAKSGGSNPFYTGADPKVIDVYRNMFDLRDARAGIVNNRNGNNNTRYVNEIPGTNISIAFEAALKEFAKTSIPKENQYIIFLSDGAQQLAADCQRDTANPRCAMQDDFIAGVNTPATYTVYLTTSRNPTIPGSLTSMTANIQGNRYSSSNPNSDIWAISSNYDNLLTLMMENIVTPMLSKATGAPKRITVSSAGVADSAGAITNGNFRFSRQLPIDTSDVTTVTMGIRYDVNIDSTWTKADNKDTTARVRTVLDSLITYTFTVRRTTGVGDPALAQQNLHKTCGPKPTLDLQYKGASVVGDGKRVTDGMGTLTIKFDNTGGILDYAAGSVIVQVMNADGEFEDVENFTLVKSGNIWTYEFPRSISASHIDGDKKLQHSSPDSIVLVFRNPRIPIDTIRVSVPFVSHTMSFYTTPNKPPRAANLVPADTSLIAGKSLDLYARLFDSEDAFDNTLDYSKITWSVAGPGGSQNLTVDAGDKSHAVFKSTTAATYTVIATYNDGVIRVEKRLSITVKPGEPAYIEVTTDPSERKVDDVSKLKNPDRYTFGEKESGATFYAVVRDEFGNYIGKADGAAWKVNETDALGVAGKGSSADVTKKGDAFNPNLRLTVEWCPTTGGGCLTTALPITVEGMMSTAIGPNPFKPGVDSPKEIYQQRNDGVYEYYKEILDKPAVGGGGGGGYKGILVAGTAPKKILPDGGERHPKSATVIIYDAVGNVVFKSKPDEITLIGANNTFGFVWNGKNSKGRTVGPGTYLVRIYADLEGGKFFEQRKIGVSK